MKNAKSCVIFTSSENKGYGDQMYRFYLNQKLVDTCINLSEGKNIKVHSYIVAAESTVFAELLKTGQKCLNMPEFTRRVMKYVIEYIYLGRVSVPKKLEKKISSAIKHFKLSVPRVTEETAPFSVEEEVPPGIEEEAPPDHSRQTIKVPPPQTTATPAPPSQVAPAITTAAAANLTLIVTVPPLTTTTTNTIAPTIGTSQNNIPGSSSKQRVMDSFKHSRIGTKKKKNDKPHHNVKNTKPCSSLAKGKSPQNNIPGGSSKQTKEKADREKQRLENLEIKQQPLACQRVEELRSSPGEGSTSLGSSRQQRKAVAEQQQPIASRREEELRPSPSKRSTSPGSSKLPAVNKRRREREADEEVSSCSNAKSTKLRNPFAKRTVTETPSTSWRISEGRISSRFCVYCGEKKFDIGNHIKIYHKSIRTKNFKCKVCGERFYLKEIAENHPSVCHR
ncbi:uncharacterized protein LOC126884900 [Diabrotica virgifera virgifera]|uniref:BTB domain-containing protein n=1 Tax=Diabrotica virgifera virgifera TaxID=50390 RepID=A0ABM5KAG7_DIAVI|nr:uncharacterized protein LOC126884900 [Diabrotica virgifera virgifera]